MTKEDFYNNEKFKATDFMEYKHDIWEFFRRYIYQIKEDKLNVTSIKVDRPLYEELKEMKKNILYVCRAYRRTCFYIRNET
jgi:hypothetical protein